MATGFNFQQVSTHTQRISHTPQKMELCTAQSISNLPKAFSAPGSTLDYGRRLRPAARTSPNLRRHQLVSTSTPLLRHSGFLYRTTSVPTAMLSEDETRGGPDLYVAEERDGAVAVEGSPPSPPPPSVGSSYTGSGATTEEPKEESPVNEQVNEILDNLNLKFDSEDTFSVVLFGGGALVALWLASAVVGAIDSIPLFPKLMEVVGLGYSFWFTTRYLLFKNNRDELAAKLEELKQQVLGSRDD